MEWWKAWVIWKMSAISDIVSFLAVAMVICFIISIVYHNAREHMSREAHVKWKRGRRWIFWLQVGGTGVLMFVFGSIATLLPTTEQMLKIIATKYAVDAVTSEQMVRHTERAGRVIDKAFDELERKLNERLSDTDRR